MANYTTLMSTGLTFGTIAAPYALTNGYIDQPTLTILVTVVILSAVVPTLVATTFFEPPAAGDEAFEDFEGSGRDRRRPAAAAAARGSLGLGTAEFGQSGGPVTAWQTRRRRGRRSQVHHAADWRLIAPDFRMRRLRESRTSSSAPRPSSSASDTRSDRAIACS